eukprot:10062627-Alexandrium_andersonii.AAC.1
MSNQAVTIRLCMCDGEGNTPREAVLGAPARLDNGKQPLGMTIGHVHTDHAIGQSMSRIGYDTRNGITEQSLEG